MLFIINYALQLINVSDTYININMLIIVFIFKCIIFYFIYLFNIINFRL